MPNELWFYSATLMAFGAIGVFYFAVATTEGAGFYCIAAFIRWVQRFCFGAVAISMVGVAANIARDHRSPSAWGFAFEITIIIALLVSALRNLLWAPALPNDASWSNPIVRHRAVTRQQARE